MAVRFGAYKMHVVTWATPEKYAQPASCHKLEFSHVWFCEITIIQSSLL